MQSTADSHADIFERMERVGTPSSVLGAALAVALLIHMGAFGYGVSRPFEVRSFADSVRSLAAGRLLATIELEDPEPPPPPDAPPPPPVEEFQKEPAPPPPALEKAPPPTPNEPQNAPAEAGKLVTAEPDPNEPLDLTDEGFVTGLSDRYAGGLTSRDGTSTAAVRTIAVRPSSSGGPPGNGNGAQGSGGNVDLSRAARPASGGAWNDCGFPPEADAEQVNAGVVTLVVVVEASGRPRSAKAISDSGHGFGRRAERCAMQKSYEVSLDKMGQAIAGPTAPFTVRFTR